MIAKGTRGSLRWGGREAARLVEWSIDDTRTLHGKVQVVNEFYCSKEPLTLDVQMGRFHWRWEGVTIDVGGDTLTAYNLPKPEIK